jgi:hypothetical protein
VQQLLARTIHKLRSLEHVVATICDCVLLFDLRGVVACANVGGIIPRIRFDVSLELPGLERSILEENPDFIV